MGEAFEAANNVSKFYLKRDEFTPKSLVDAIENESTEVTDSIEDDCPLVDEVTASTESKESSCSEDSYSSGKDDAFSSDIEEAEEESGKAYEELVAVLQSKGIPLDVLDNPRIKEWLAKYTGVYRSSWHC